MYMKTLILVGMMGVGKSFAGKIIAQKLLCDFYDLDNEIEKDEKLSISEIFKIHGDNYFREKEFQVLKKIYKPEGLVIALGGGAFINTDIREMLINSANVVYLEASPQTIFNRIKDNNDRPLLENRMNIETIEQIINSRKEKYKLAHYTIITDNKNIEDVVGEILKCVY